MLRGQKLYMDFWLCGGQCLKCQACSRVNCTYVLDSFWESTNNIMMFLNESKFHSQELHFYISTSSLEMPEWKRLDTSSFGWCSKLAIVSLVKGEISGGLFPRDLNFHKVIFVCAQSLSCVWLFVTHGLQTTGPL